MSGELLKHTGKLTEKVPDLPLGVKIRLDQIISMVVFMFIYWQAKSIVLI